MASEIDPVFGCELVQSKLNGRGYANHAERWRAEFGPVPEGFELDHTCRRRNCVALHHLEAVTKSENMMRKSWAYRSKRKQCAKGHDLKLFGVVTPEGGKVCRQCNKEARGDT